MCYRNAIELTSLTHLEVPSVHAAVLQTGDDVSGMSRDRGERDRSDC